MGRGFRVEFFLVVSRNKFSLDFDDIEEVRNRFIDIIYMN